MKFSKKKLILLISLVSAVGLLLVPSIFKKNLSQSNEVAYAREVPNQTQTENFNQDLNKAEDYWVHNRLGRQYDDLGDYDKAIEEYKKSIAIIESNPGEDWTDVSREEMARINQESKNDTQIFPRYRLVKVLEKAGRYPEALEQIDWLLAHRPSDHVKQELPAKKSELLQKIKSGDT